MNSIREMLERAAKLYAKDSAVQYLDNDRQIISRTFYELKEDSVKLGKGFIFNHLQGKKIAIIGNSSYEWMISFFGCMYIGTIVIPIDNRLPKEDRIDILQRAEASVLIYDISFADEISDMKGCLPQLNNYICMESGNKNRDISIEEVSDDCRNEILVNDIDPDACCMIMYTSGTSGKSKGVMLTQRGMAENAEYAVNQAGFHNKNTKVMSILPLFHIFGMSDDILWPLAKGLTLCLNSNLNELFVNAKLFCATRIAMVPMIAEYIYKNLQIYEKTHPGLSKQEVLKDLMGRHMKVFTIGGAYLDLKIKAGLKKYGLDVSNGYGMTETSCTISTEQGVRPKEGSVGKIIPCLQVSCIDQEIVVRGSSVMLGYYHDEESTEAVLTDGWLRTGDIGYIDKDQYLFLTGRKKNMIITSSGENVSPEELEAKLVKFELIKEVLVYQKKEQIVAEIFMNTEMIKKKDIVDVDHAVADIINQVNKQNPRYKHIQHLYLRQSEFEKTASMKIKREKYIVGKMD